MANAADLANEFGQLEDDPFAYNETATVSLLIAAATRAEMLALAEFVSMKKVNRVPVEGRCDLWICGRRQSWAFEVKQAMYRGGYHRPSTIMGWLKDACNDARKLTHHEADKRFGLLVISTLYADEIDPDFVESLERVISKTDYAWQICPASKFASDTFLLFKEVRKKRSSKSRTHGKQAHDR
jgi:hypothetical protein